MTNVDIFRWDELVCTLSKKHSALFCKVAVLGEEQYADTFTASPIHQASFKIPIIDIKGDVLE